jgi:SPP1 gp7 family putative phage head morphogenesis protein
MNATFDDIGPTMRQRARTGRIERMYGRRLRSLARHVGELIEGYEVGEGQGLPGLTELLRAYARALKPWAVRTAQQMLGGIDDAERNSWRALGNAISGQLHRNIERSPVGERMRELLDLQVGLITSIPTKAAERVHKLTIEALESSARAKEAAAEIANSANVTASRALLIARTETSRTSTALLQARCESIGSTHYVWETARDGAVRSGHKVMQGKVCEWAEPPAVATGSRIYHHHPGEIFNCRCWARPIINDPYKRERAGRLL